MIDALILTLPRTGSTYLSWIMYYHLNGLSEPRNTEFFDQAVTVDEIDHIIDNYDSLNKTRVLKLHQYHMQCIDNADRRDRVLKLINNAPVYTCLRRNFFELCMSHAIAQHTNLWKFYNEMPSDITIKTDDFVSVVRHKLNDYENLVNNKWNLTIKKHIVYEDLTYNTEQDFNTLGLGLAKFTGASIPYHKSPDKKQVVQNIDDLHACAQEVLLGINYNLPLNVDTLEVNINDLKI